MAIKKSKEEINSLLSKIIKTPFKHRGEIAETLKIHPKTLNGWVEDSDYSWDDFNITYRKSLYKTIIELGGIEYIQYKFEQGYKFADISRELGASESLTHQTIMRILNENNLTKEELGYVRY